MERLNGGVYRQQVVHDACSRLPVFADHPIAAIPLLVVYASVHAADAIASSAGDSWPVSYVCDIMGKYAVAPSSVSGQDLVIPHCVLEGLEICFDFDRESPNNVGKLV